MIITENKDDLQRMPKTFYQPPTRYNINTSVEKTKFRCKRPKVHCKLTVSNQIVPQNKHFGAELTANHQDRIMKMKGQINNTTKVSVWNNKYMNIDAKVLI